MTDTKSHPAGKTPADSAPTNRANADRVNAAKTAKDFEKPAHWTNDPPPEPKKVEQDETLSPTRYGDWVNKGIAIDF